MKKELYEQTCYIVYVPGHGYLKSKTGTVTKDFSKARIYSQANHAKLSVNMLRSLLDKLYKQEGKVLPVHVKIDPHDIFNTELSR